MRRGGTTKRGDKVEEEEKERKKGHPFGIFFGHQTAVVGASLKEENLR